VKKLAKSLEKLADLWKQLLARLLAQVRAKLLDKLEAFLPRMPQELCN